jgi:hypothetical protein
VPTPEELRRQASALNREVISQFSGGPARGYINFKGLRDVAFLYAKAASDLTDLTRNEMLNFQKKVVDYSRQAFEASIKEPAFSATRGGVVYGRGGNRDRQTTNFRFGGSGAFVTRRVFNRAENRYEIRWPDVAEADEQTKGIWRVLESGLPASLHRLPRRFTWNPNVEPFTPVRGPATRPGKGFDGKFFLRDGFDRASGELLPTFDQIVRKALRGL